MTAIVERDRNVTNNWKNRKNTFAQNKNKTIKIGEQFNLRRMQTQITEKLNLRK